jgi:hypothetical protein
MRGFAGGSLARLVRRFVLVGVSVCVLPVLVGVASAVAAVPAFTLSTTSLPRHLPPGGEGIVALQVADLGDAGAEGAVSPIVVTDTLPESLEATAVSSGAECVLVSVQLVHCEDRGGLAPFNGQIEVVMSVKVSGSASGALVNEASAGGGGAINARISEPVFVSSEPAGNGLEKLQNVFVNEDGSPDTLAGSHPFQMNTTVVPNTANTKDVHLVFPQGFVANTNVLAQCTTAEFDEILREHANGCPADSAVGVAKAFLGPPGQLEFEAVVPVFNLVPAPGEPIRLGFAPESIPVIIDTGVRTGKDYAAFANVNNIQQLLGFQEAQLAIWGVPADPAHNADRGWNCLFHQLGLYGEGEFPCSSPENPRVIPFLTLPSACTDAAGLVTSANADTWLNPGVFPGEEVTSTPAQGLGGCNRMRFEPSVSVAADGSAASTPTGLAVHVHEPQEGALNPTGVSASDVKSIRVTLPEGVDVNPSRADGLGVCTTAEIGFTGSNPSTGAPEFTSGVPGCPDSSKIATVKIQSPLLPNALEGEVYLAAPQNYVGGPLENPFGSLIAAYIVAQDPVSGVLVKLPGRVTPDPVTGRLTATFESPELPFEDAELHFFGSARAPLSTPPLCGSYETTTLISPWSGTEAVSPSSSFDITSGPDGTPCADPRPFSPELQAGTTNIQAGALTPFTLTMTRPDADQTLSRIEMSMPPGLLASLSNVKLCPEPQAGKGECSPESLIGHTVVSAGLGGDPYTVTGGRVYITTAYGSGEYGLSIVNPAVAGPFVLQEGRPVIVRASITLDPHTAQIKIVSDPLPTIIDGIPLQIQHVNVTVERPGGFAINPTNCSRFQINATLTSTENATAAASTPFQVTNCATLAFNPKLTATTTGRTSKANGASLHVKLTYPAGPYDANIASVKVDLPIQLPSRLSTLQKACTAAQFEANPAGCPPASIVGHAKASTPLIPVPLEGPAYFVSHGGEAFPSLIIDLQGYGTSIQLIGTTAIKHGITSSTFKTVPDAPVGTFELTLPQGKYSALAAFGNLCKSKLAMPTHYTAQNGAEINTTTPITTTNCTINTKKAQTHTNKKKKGKKKG